jgi:tetratricopeptide (TPR) repeat protein
MVAGLLLLSIAALSWRIADHVGASKLRRLTPPTLSGAAYTNYQSGRLRLERQYRGDYIEALNNFDAAIKLDPHFAAAYAGKADAEFYLYSDNGTHDEISLARSAIKRAIELDPNSSYAHSLLCRIEATYDWDFAEAESECRRSVALDPENDEARMELAFLLNSIGRRDDALKEMDTAVALAPTSFNKRSRGKLLYFARRYDEAIAQLNQVEATDPEYTECSHWMATSFEQKKDYAQALEFLIKYRESDGAGPGEIALLRQAFATGGWPEVLRISLPQGQPKPNLETAGTFAQLGYSDKAFEVLDKMVTDRRLMIVQMDSDPRLDPLRSDPRFEQLAKRVGLR